MQIVLDEQAWRQVLAILAQAPWQAANPLIMAIGAQMQAQTPGAQGPPSRGLTDVPLNDASRRGNSGDPAH